MRQDGIDIGSEALQRVDAKARVRRPGRRERVTGTAKVVRGERRNLQ